MPPAPETARRGGQGWDRTIGLQVFRLALCQLSYLTADPGHLVHQADPGSGALLELSGLNQGPEPGSVPASPQSGWRDSNPRPPGPEPGALAKLRHSPSPLPHFIGQGQW